MQKSLGKGLKEYDDAEHKGSRKETNVLMAFNQRIYK